MNKAKAGLRPLLNAFACLTVLGGASIAEAIIIRHDVNPRQHEVRASEFPAVFFLEQQGTDRVCAATVIHARWAITAAHCAYETSLLEKIEADGQFGVQLAGRERSIEAVMLHPDYEMEITASTDLALLRFADVSALPVIALQTEPTELAEVATLVGWGFSGLGTTGRQFSDGTIRMAMNRITTAGNRLEMLFDDPRLPESDALPLEGTPGLWDSGGPALLGSPGGYRLAGIAVGEIEGERFSEETQGRYGAVAVYERISLHVEWIRRIIDTDTADSAGNGATPFSN